MTVLFPQLMREFNVDTATVQWITTIYLLAVAATMPLSSFIKRRFRNKTIFVAAVVLAVLGSLIMIVAQGVPADPRRARDPGRRFGHGHAADDEHHPWNSRPRSKVGRLMGVGSLVIHRGAGHRPDRRGAVTSVLPWRAIFVIVIPYHPADLAAGWPEVHPAEASDRGRRAQPVAVRVDRADAVWSDHMFLNQAGVAVGAAVSGGEVMAPALIAVASLVVGVGSLLFFGWSSRKSFSAC